MTPGAEPRVAGVSTENNVGKVYTVAAYRSVSDPAALAAYAELAGPAIIAAGGRILARGMPVATFEGGLNQRMIIVEWDSLEQAVATRRSEAYQAAIAKLGDTAERDISMKFRVQPAAGASDAA